MNLILNLLVAVQMLAALAMIGLILIQHGKGADMGAAFGSGSAGSLFGASGSANFLSRTTAVLAAVFFVCTLLLAYFSQARPAGSGGNSLLERAAIGVPAGAASAAIPVAPPAPSGASTIPGIEPAAAPAPAPSTTVPAPATPAPAPAAAPASAPAASLSSPPPTAAAVTDAPVQAEVSAAVNGWAAAWAAKDANRYLAAYDAEFEPSGKQTRKAWEAERRARLADKGDISVSLQNLSVRGSGDTAVAKFDQSYKSTALNSNNRKTLELVRRDGKWLIRREVVGG
ncbi:MAG: preprotein translocase subunit SecG [Comamonadaceae bacterium]|nr:MAG: preprotein translocase subunit SecG [Comamonadaceae bacterium]